MYSCPGIQWCIEWKRRNVGEQTFANAVMERNDVMKWRHVDVDQPQTTMRHNLGNRERSLIVIMKCILVDAQNIMNNVSNIFRPASLTDLIRRNSRIHFLRSQCHLRFVLDDSYNRTTTTTTATSFDVQLSLDASEYCFGNNHNKFNGYVLRRIYIAIHGTAWPSG